MPCDFYLWGMLKNKVYKTNPHTLNELKENIQTTIRSIMVEELVHVNNNFLKRCETCIQENGQHIENLL